jgi:hypothetical protein
MSTAAEKQEQVEQTSELKCYTHDFTTRDLLKWKAHQSGPGHYSVGSGNCRICGEEYAFTLDDLVPTADVMNGDLAHPECREAETKNKQQQK